MGELSGSAGLAVVDILPGAAPLIADVRETEPHPERRPGFPQEERRPGPAGGTACGALRPTRRGARSPAAAVPQGDPLAGGRRRPHRHQWDRPVSPIMSRVSDGWATGNTCRIPNAAEGAGSDRYRSPRPILGRGGPGLPRGPPTVAAHPGPATALRGQRTDPQKIGAKREIPHPSSA